MKVLNQLRHLFTRRSLLLMLILLSVQKDFAQAPVITFFTPTSSAVAQEVDIHGIYLTNTTAVNFGNVPAIYFTAVSDTEVIAYPGVGASGSVSVTTTTGSTSLGGFIFLAPPVISSFSPTSGGYGDTITIKGSGLSNVYAVSFGDYPASTFTVLSDSVIQAVVNDGASGMVEVDDNLGTDSLGYFYYLGPVISYFTPTTGDSGTVVKIIGSNFTGATQVYVGDTPAVAYTIKNDTLITATVGKGALGDVIVITAKGVADVPGFGFPYVSAFDPQSGTLGTPITITGLNFTGVTTVSFGDSAASFTVLSDTVIQAIVGNGNSGALIVSNGVLGDTSYFFYYFNYQPQITSFTPTTAHQGDTITINGYGFTGIDSVSFGGKSATWFKVVTDSEIVAVLGDGNSGYIFVSNITGNTDSVSGFNFLFYPPTITSVYPMSGNIGSAVTITGKNFAGNPSGNIVYFGTVKAAVTTCTDTSLIVTVPTGASYQPISVTKEGLTAYSDKPFIITFSSGNQNFNPLSFIPQRPLHTTGSNPQSIVAADFDNDGKTDIAVVYGFFGTTNNIVSVYRNISTGDSILFDTAIQYNIGTQGGGGFAVATGDINGDGKMDLVTTSSDDDIASIFINTSTPGHISFATRTDFTTGINVGSSEVNTSGVTVNDFDGDGKPDIALANFGLISTVTTMINASNDTVTNFIDKSDNEILDATGVYSSDLNNDNKPDIVVGTSINGATTGQIDPLINTSTPGSITFQGDGAVGDNYAVYDPDVNAIALGDLDGDGKTDMVAAYNNSSRLAIFMNTTAPGQLVTFATPIDIVVGYSLHGVSIADMDGDGKPDIVVSTGDSSRIAVLKNNSTVGTFSFSSPVYYNIDTIPQAVITADLNNDGKPDIIVANSGNASVSIFKNAVGNPVDLCPPVANTTLNAYVSGSSFQWQISNDSGNTFSNITNNNYYNGSTTSLLQISNLPDSLTGVIYRCITNGTPGNNYQLRFTNTWTGAKGSLWTDPANWSCGVLPDKYTDVIINNGIVVLSSTVTIRSLTVNPGASFTITSPYNLTITH